MYGFVKLLVIIFNRAMSVSGGSMREKRKRVHLNRIDGDDCGDGDYRDDGGLSFIQMVRSNQLQSDTRDFVDLLSETRSEAIFKQSDRVVALDSSVATPFKTLVPTHVTKTSGDSSVTFNRLGQTSVSTNGQLYF